MSSAGSNNLVGTSLRDREFPSSMVERELGITDWKALESAWQGVLTNVGPQFLNRGLMYRFQSDLIFISSNLEGIDLTIEVAEAIVDA